MAANSMTPSVAPAPQGLDLLGPDPLSIDDIQQDDTPAVEIMIEDPEGVQIGIDGLEIDLMPEPETAEAFDANLAEYMDEGELGALASDLLGEYDSDVSSRKEWADMYVKGLEVLGMKYEERTEPWEGACGVYSTVLTEAAIRFQSETIIETFPAQGPVKTEIIGAIDKLKEEAAERVRADMNFKLTEEMPEYRPEHERMLYNLGLAGAAFKKVYFDPSLGRQAAVFIPAEDIVIPYGASNARTAERVTHVMRKTKNDVKKLQVAGFYRDVDLGEPLTFHSDIEKRKAEDQGFTLSDDNRYQLLEMCVDYDLPGYEDEDGIALPYVITIDRSTTKVLAIRRNWNEDDPLKLKRQHFVQYTYVPGFGVYGLGLIHIIGGYARAGTALIRQLVDAGTLSNLPGGLKSRGLRIKGDDTPIAPGEWRDVDVASGAVRDNIMPLPYKEPSQVLMALLGQITDEARRLGSVADMKVSDMSANAPVGTTLAILERQLKTMSAVQARVHYSMKEEFKLLKVIIRDNTPGEYEYTPEGGNRKAKREDYDMVDVIPVSDPNSATMAQRIMQYQAVIQLAAQAPQIYDLPMLHRQMIEVLGIKNADKLVPVDDDLTPRDPVSENMAFLTGKPTKAFIYQVHDAHIAVHMAMMQDPLLMAQVGQSPQGQKMQAEIMAHVSEHLAFAYRKKVEEQLGVPMPTPNENLPEDVEVQLSRLVAQASQQVLAQSKGQAAQQQAQQAAQDPLVQMQQQELQIKMQEAQTKAQKVQGDLALREADMIGRQEIAEKKLQIDAARTGTMGRAEDQNILNADRLNAEQLEIQIAQWAASNQLGISNQQHQQKMQQAEASHQQQMRQQAEKIALAQQNQAALSPVSKGE